MMEMILMMQWPSMDLGCWVARAAEESRPMNPGPWVERCSPSLLLPYPGSAVFPMVVQVMVV